MLDFCNQKIDLQGKKYSQKCVRKRKSFSLSWRNLKSNSCYVINRRFSMKVIFFSKKKFYIPRWNVAITWSNERTETINAYTNVLCGFARRSHPRGTFSSGDNEMQAIRDTNDSNKTRYNITPQDKYFHLMMLLSTLLIITVMWNKECSLLTLCKDYDAL